MALVVPPVLLSNCPSGLLLPCATMTSMVEVSGDWWGADIIDVFADIWDFDPGWAVILVLAAAGFVATTAVLVSKVVRGTVGSTRQIHTWLRDSGSLTPAGPSTLDLGRESPAVVNLLLTHGRITRNAVRATVLDLAARGAVALHQPGADPIDTIVMRINNAAGDLNVYERR